jgi:pimeloyl-ACP methyl ester carboxylesterase
MAEIMLVHGAMHGAWCWNLLRPELERLGHRTHAVDLPIERPDTDLDTYADCVATELDKLPENAWLVGHSMGGRVIPKVSLQRPVAGLIFLATMVPGLSDADQNEMLTAVDVGRFSDFVTADGLQTITPANAISHFYAACPPDLQRWAISRLRPQSALALASRPPLPRWPDVPMQAILTRDDAIIRADAMAALFRRRFGREPVMLPGDHSPFLCCPRELAAAIDATIQQGIQQG